MDVTKSPRIPWDKSITKEGYDQVTVGGKNRLAHRVAYAKANRIDIDLLPGVVMHTCDNKWCVNPYHLVLGIQADNMKDKVNKGRQAKGETHGNAKITEQQAREIRERYIKGNGNALAREYGISRRQIGNIVNGGAW